MSKIFDKAFKKLKSIKHIEVVIAVLFGIILLALYLSTINNGNAYKTSASNSSGYTFEIENRLSDVLSDIEGAGKVNVMVMLKEGENLDSNTVPKLESVIVVAEGAKNYKVKIELLKAVEAILNLPTTNIEILVGNK